jgi:ribosomal protein S18 acetylase RimI-like enzyme
MTALLRSAGQEGIAKIFLVTGAENRPVRALYESLGAGLAEQGPTVNYWWNLERSDRQPR